MYVVFRVVDKAERRHGTRFEPQVAFHALRRGEGEFALPQSAFQIVNRQRAVAVETDQIMTGALVVAEEEVLAVHAAIVFPPAFCLLYGFAFGMVVAAEWNVVFFKVVENLFLSFGYLFHSFIE